MNQLNFEHRFNYRSLLIETGTQMALSPPFPVIEIELTYNGSTRTALSLIDSGSTFSVFSRVLADELGVDVLQGRVQRLSTLGGSVLAYGHELEIEITPEVRYSTEVLFTEYPVPRNLLGHHGFFDRVAVALRSKYGLIYLQPES